VPEGIFINVAGTGNAVLRSLMFATALNVSVDVRDLQTYAADMPGMQGQVGY